MNKPIVIPKPITVQNIFLQKKGFIKGTYTWTMNNFLDMKLPVLSPAFDVGGQKWCIFFYSGVIDSYNMHTPLVISVSFQCASSIQHYQWDILLY